MKKGLIILVVIFFSTSCFKEKEQQTIQLAKEVDSIETPQTRILYYYASLYSARPQNKQQLAEYAKSYVKYTAEPGQVRLGRRIQRRPAQ